MIIATFILANENINLNNDEEVKKTLSRTFNKISSLTINRNGGNTPEITIKFNVSNIKDLKELVIEPYMKKTSLDFKNENEILRFLFQVDDISLLKYRFFKEPKITLTIVEDFVQKIKKVVEIKNGISENDKVNFDKAINVYLVANKRTGIVAVSEEGGNDNENVILFGEQGLDYIIQYYVKYKTLNAKIIANSLYESLH